MPTYRIRFADSRPDELVEADRLVERAGALVLLGTAYVMNRPRDVVLRHLRRVDVLGVDLAAP